MLTGHHQHVDHSRALVPAPFFPGQAGIVAKDKSIGQPGDDLVRQGRRQRLLAPAANPGQPTPQRSGPALFQPHHARRLRAHQQAVLDALAEVKLPEVHFPRVPWPRDRREAAADSHFIADVQVQQLPGHHDLEAIAAGPPVSFLPPGGCLQDRFPALALGPGSQRLLQLVRDAGRFLVQITPQLHSRRLVAREAAQHAAGPHVSAIVVIGSAQRSEADDEVTHSEPGPALGQKDEQPGGQGDGGQGQAGRKFGVIEMVEDDAGGE